MFDAKEKKAYIYSVKNDRKYDTFSKWITALKNLRLFKGHRSALQLFFWNQILIAHQLHQFLVNQIILHTGKHLRIQVFRKFFC